MNIIDHGVWVRYTPEVLPETAPNGAIFAKRESDGVDWYDYVRPDFLRMHPPKQPTYDTNGKVIEPNLKSNFHPDGIVCNVFHHRDHDAHIVGATVRGDPTAVYAINQRIIEITGYTGDDPHKDFGGKVYDHVSKKFGEKPQFKPPPPTPFEEKMMEALNNIATRLEKLESK
jgi:hypothetical protein